MLDSQSSTPTPLYCSSNASLSAHLSTSQASGDTGVKEQSAKSQEMPASPPTPTTATRFTTHTIAPSPPPNLSTSPDSQSILPTLDTSSRLCASPSTPGATPSPLSAGLRIHTDIPGYTVTAASAIKTTLSPAEVFRASTNTMSIPRTPSMKKALSGSMGGGTSLASAPNSVVSSPMLNAMPDVTPLPSPLMSGDSPGPWRKLAARRAAREEDPSPTADSALITVSGEPISSAIANQSKRRGYHGLGISEFGLTSTVMNGEKVSGGHTRNRSLSDYVPEAIQGSKPRSGAIANSQRHSLEPAPKADTPLDTHMRREPYLAVERGLMPIPRPPTPPKAGAEGDDIDTPVTAIEHTQATNPLHEYFEAHTRDDPKMRKWRALKVLGAGTFSKVVLATSQLDEYSKTSGDASGEPMEGVVVPADVKSDLKKLVAIKICEHGPSGGASSDRVEMSLKRELELMKTLRHPSLVHLKAWNIEETRALLVLGHCPGGDLFDLAVAHRDLLVPGLLRRIFAELIGAVRYLHGAHIVHRDIKLENVLINLLPDELAGTQDWTNYPYSIITLTDLGLSRHVADDELLKTRCGSEDYIAPEVLMGQDYDGRAVDAWSLGVLLYALLESRLPFDAHPNMTEAQRSRNRSNHRIARVEWAWADYAGEEGDHEGDPEKFKAVGLEGAMLATEGLLRRARSRWTLDQVAELEWIHGAVTAPGGIRFREEDSPAVMDIDSPPV